MVWSMASTRDSNEFWTREFIDPAVLVRLELKKLGETVDGGAPVEPATHSPPAHQGQLVTQQVHPPPTIVEPRPKRGRESEGQYYTVNRKSKPLCPDFVAGGCTDGPVGSAICPRDAALRHQCPVCLGLHRAGDPDCGNPVPVKPPGKRGRGGRGGRGGARGAGAGRGAGRQPWRVV